MKLYKKITSKLFISVLLSLGLMGCFEQTVNNEVNLTQNRANEIKKRIEQEKHWGSGHSPIPRKIINATTLNTMLKEIKPSDSPSLLILLDDEANDIRYAVTSLLACIAPNAELEIEKMLKLETNTNKINKLMEAKMTLNLIKTGSTFCK